MAGPDQLENAFTYRGESGVITHADFTRFLQGRIDTGVMIMIFAKKPGFGLYRRQCFGLIGFDNVIL